MSFRPEENGFINSAYGLSRQAFSGYVQLRKRNSQGLDLPEGYVPDTVYVLENDEGDYVGIVNLRHCLNEALRQGAGHIGYGIRPEYRGRGYATAALALALEDSAKDCPGGRNLPFRSQGQPHLPEGSAPQRRRVDHEDDRGILHPHSPSPIAANQAAGLAKRQGVCYNSSTIRLGKGWDYTWQATRTSG